MKGCLAGSRAPRQRRLVTRPRRSLRHHHQAHSLRRRIFCSSKAQHHLPKTIRDIPSPSGTLDTRKLYQDSSLESSAAIRREDAPLLTRRYRSPRPLDPRRNPLLSPEISIVSGINLLFSTQIPSFISQLVITLERSYCWIERFDRNRFSRPDNLCPR